MTSEQMDSVKSGAPPAQHPITGRIVADIKRFRQDAAPELPTTLFQSHESRHMWFDAEMGSLFVTGDECTLHKQVVALVQDYKGIGSRRSVTRIERCLNGVIIAHLNNGIADDVELHHCVDNMLSELLKDVPPRTVYFPVAGLKLEGVSLEIGDVVFAPLSEAFSHKMKTYLAERMSFSPEPDREKILERLVQDFDKTFRDVSVGQMEIAADAEVTLDVGLAQVNDRLDFVAAMMPCIFGFNKRVWFEVGPPPGRDEICAYSLVADGFQCKSYTPRPVVSFVIGANRKQRLEQVGFTQLADIVKKPSRNNTETRLLRMAKWFGRSMRIVGQQEQYLLAANALEAAFTPDDASQPVTQNLTDGVAFVLGRNADQRKAIHKNVTELYRQRSKLVHGKSFELQLADLRSLQAYVFDALAVLLNNTAKFRTVDLDSWLREQKYSGTNDLCLPPAPTGS